MKKLVFAIMSRTVLILNLENLANRPVFQEFRENLEYSGNFL